MKSIKLVTDVLSITVFLAIDSVAESEVFEENPEGAWFFLYNGDALAGAINLRAINNVLWVPHIFIFEEHRGKGSEKWGKLVARFMRKNLGAKKFLVLTPVYAAKLYAERVGFKYLAYLERSVKKNGELLDQYMLELGDIS
jgi:RimJ/RimL family protein N-acetyltransferase